MPRPVKKRRVALPEKIGKIRQHLLDHYSIFPEDVKDLKNGHVILLHIDNDRSIGKTLKVQCQITPAPLQSLLNRTKKFQGGVNNAAMEKYSSLCCESFKSVHHIQEDQQLDPEEPQGHSDPEQSELGLANLDEPQPGPSYSLEQSEQVLDADTPITKQSIMPKSSVRSSQRHLLNLTPETKTPN